MAHSFLFVKLRLHFFFCHGLARPDLQIYQARRTPYIISRFGYDLGLTLQFAYILLFFFRVQSRLSRLCLDTSSVYTSQLEKEAYTSNRTGSISLTSAAAYEKEPQVSIGLLGVVLKRHCVFCRQLTHLALIEEWDLPQQQHS
jgi:hypothetical protein